MNPIHSMNLQCSYKDARKIELLIYISLGDSKTHIMTFWITAGRVDLDERDRDAGYCRLFAERFSKLAKGSIDSWHVIGGFPQTLCQMQSCGLEAMSLKNLLGYIL